MKKLTTCIFLLNCLVQQANAQINKGINFQAIARKANGLIVANKTIAIRLSIKNDSSLSAIEYQEIKSVTTNVLGLFTVMVGLPESNKIVSMGNFENIQWTTAEKYIQIEIDPEGTLLFESLGTHKINYVPFSFYADNVNAKNVAGIISITQGGTGVTNLKSLSTILNIEKVNNTPDSIKPITSAALLMINEKLKKIDTLTLSNRINQKLNKTDTLSLSNRINKKIETGDLSLAAIISGLGYTPARSEYGSFYDTAKQQTTISTATAVKFSSIQLSNNIGVVNNSTTNPTKITVTHAGTYNIRYTLQIIKSDAGNDEVSVWIRRNGSAYANTLTNYVIIGGAIKNNLTGSSFVELGDNDYVEIYFSVKNINTCLVGTLAQSSPTPSRPGTPAAAVTIHCLN